MSSEANELAKARVAAADCHHDLARAIADRDAARAHLEALRVRFNALAAESHSWELLYRSASESADVATRGWAEAIAVAAAALAGQSRLTRAMGEPDNPNTGPEHRSE